MSYSFFLWVVMFNFTIVWVRENSIFLFRTQKSCSLSCLQPCQLYASDAFCLTGTALMPFAYGIS